MRSTFRSLSNLLAGAFAVSSLFLLVVPSGSGCSSSTAATNKPATGRCTAGNYVFCRCQDRQEGTKLCLEDGQSFGKCEPCESETNPEVPIEPDPDSGTEEDGGQTQGTCGDKIVQQGEDCDDGNKVNDDGCDDKCKLAGSDPVGSRSCTGLDVHVWGPPVTWSSTSVGAPNTGSTSPNCTASADGGEPGTIATTGAAASDRVLKVTPHKTGTLTVATSNVDYDSFLYISDQCKGTDNPWLKCTNKVSGAGGETLVVPVQANKVYFVFVDGAGISGQNGKFTVTLSIQ